MNSSVQPGVLLAFLLRELRTSVLSRSVHLLGGLCLVVGLLPLWTSGGEGADYTLLQASLWIVPLFALLTGIDSAQAEEEERAFLGSQPVGGAHRVIGKFVGLALMLALVTGLLVLPATIAGVAGLGVLWLHTLGIGAIFTSLGLAVGFSTGDRIKAHMLGLGLWLLLLVGSDLLALATARSGWAAEHPDAWLGFLMTNPLDALRIGMVIRLERIPFESASLSPLGQWWVGNLGLWFVLLTAGWITLALAWAGFRLARREF